MPGVVRTRVGYAGGTKIAPTYNSLGDHSETVQIDYDPTQISYLELLDVFWNSHDPSITSSRQYMSIIFYHNGEQKKLAVASRNLRQSEEKIEIVTEIIPAGKFYFAEDYHQKYYLRRVQELAQDFDAIYPEGNDFINSTAATRVNGYLGGNGTYEALLGEIDSFGLSPASRERLLEIVSG